jgi:nicotinate phosphoribosyltransferase
MKLSSSKQSLPNEKQVFRFYGIDGSMVRDVVSMKNEDYTNEMVEPLLQTVMENGKTIKARESLIEIRGRFESDFSKLPTVYKVLRNTPRYPVSISPELRRSYGNTRKSILNTFEPHSN